MKPVHTPLPRPIRVLDGTASKEQIEAAIAVRHKEIEWNIRRLANLILDDEDRQQTEDLIMDLREERESLKRCLNVA